MPSDKQMKGKLLKIEVMGRLLTLLLGVGMAVFMIEIVVRILYFHLPFQVQEMTSGARLWGIGGPPLGAILKNFNDICTGDERLYSRLLPNLNGVLVRSGPNFYRVSTVDLGFKDIGFRTEESNGSWDGLILGDSFSFCMGVDFDKCWVRLLAQKTNLQLADLGVVATGSVSHLRYLEDYGWSLNPKFIIWQYWVNDPMEDYAHIYLNKQGCPRLEPQKTDESTKPLQGLRTWLNKTFVSYNLVVAPVLRALFPKLSGSTNQTKPIEQILTKNGKHLLLLNPQPPEDDPQFRTGLDMTKGAILEAAKQANERKCGFLLILAPSNLQAYIQFLPSERLVEMAKAEDAGMDSLVELAREKTIPFIDLRSNFREAVMRGDDLYLEYDGHWNPNGNRVAADAITEWLQDHRDFLDTRK